MVRGALPSSSRTDVALTTSRSYLWPAARESPEMMTRRWARTASPTMSASLATSFVSGRTTGVTAGPRSPRQADPYARGSWAKPLAVAKGGIEPPTRGFSATTGGSRAYESTACSACRPHPDLGLTQAHSWHSQPEAGTFPRQLSPASRLVEPQPGCSRNSDRSSFASLVRFRRSPQ